MKEYRDLVRYVLDNGCRKENRTGVATLSCFAYFYRIDISRCYPLITTKKMHFDSMLHELFWYLSGEHHIRKLKAHTRIWDAWADEKGNLETAYGRFWRRYPVPEAGLDGERWATRWVRKDEETGTFVFDQIRYIIDSLKEIRRNPEGSGLRRLIVIACYSLLTMLIARETGFVPGEFAHTLVGCPYL